MGHQFCKSVHLQRFYRLLSPFKLASPTTLPPPARCSSDRPLGGAVGPGGPLAPPSGGGTRAEICQVAICARQKTYYKDAPCQITESDCDPLVFPHLAIRYSDVQILHHKINFILTELLCYSSKGFPARFN